MWPAASSRTSQKVWYSQPATNREKVSLLVFAGGSDPSPEESLRKLPSGAKDAMRRLMYVLNPSAGKARATG